MLSPRTLSFSPLRVGLAAPAGFAALVGLLAVACDQKAPEPAPAKPPPSAPLPPVTPVTLSAAVARPAAERVVAIGDLHGDLEATRRVLRLAGAIDDRDHWAGGKLVVVQTGDLIDRGDGDRDVLELVERLVTEAKAAGGEFVSVLGNHEIMNVALDFRYVTPGGFSAFRNVAPRASASPDGAHGAPSSPSARASSSSEVSRGRGTAFAPGGPFAVRLAEKPLFVKVGDNVFVHGGVLPKHVDYGLDKMNDGPIWTRAYSNNERAAPCPLLTEALAKLGAKRMVVGHTPQQGGISSACNERVWRIDVGLSRFYGGPTQALEIGPAGPKVLRQEG